MDFAGKNLTRETDGVWCRLRKRSVNVSACRGDGERFSEGGWDDAVPTIG